MTNAATDAVAVPSQSVHVSEEPSNECIIPLDSEHIETQQSSAPASHENCWCTFWRALVNALSLERFADPDAERGLIAASLEQTVSRSQIMS